METIGPLDAVITGYPYELTSSAIGVIEDGNEATGWISPETIAALDNFIAVVLFNERVFFTGVPRLSENRFVPGEARYSGGPDGKTLFDNASFLAQAPPQKADDAAVWERADKIVEPVDMTASPLFTIEAMLQRQHSTMRQETVYLDVFFIEYAIEQFGLHRFKPVFPGEHLYLGLRQKRIGFSHATHTVADLPARRLRTIVSEKMDQLNAFVAQGARLLPRMTPMFVTRILSQCNSGQDFVPMLLKIRNSPLMRRFRSWLSDLHRLSQSSDYSERGKAADALAKLEALKQGISPTDAAVGAVALFKDIITHDPIGGVADLVKPVIAFLSAIPLLGLYQFKSETHAFNAFLRENFGGSFNRKIWRRSPSCCNFQATSPCGRTKELICKRARSASMATRRRSGGPFGSASRVAPTQTSPMRTSTICSSKPRRFQKKRFMNSDSKTCSHQPGASEDAILTVGRWVLD